MKYICAQPAIKYYAWQIDAMLYSFKDVGVDLKDVHIVLAGAINEEYMRLMYKYPAVLFSFYEDTREDKAYISSIRPHVLKKHFANHEWLKNEVIFYHDSDIALTRKLDIDQYLSDNKCYLSDTISYIGYNYIKSKGDDVLQKMLSIVGIEEETVKLNQENSGGAQYLIKGIDKQFWEDVEKDCVNLYKDISALNADKKIADPNHHELQIWCADMWAVLWNLWKRNKETAVIKELDFSWATSSINEWSTKAIFHNAGVTSDREDLFFKGKYIDTYPDLTLELSDKFCSYNYYNIIKKL